MDNSNFTCPLWKPSSERLNQAASTEFIRQVNEKHALSLSTFHDLYRWSVEEPSLFWAEAWRFLGLRSAPYDPKASDNSALALNFAEKLLSRRDDKTAIRFYGEESTPISLTYRELWSSVSKLQQRLIKGGVTRGDRVAAIISNMPESVIGMLASSSIGAIWTSCSPDFGVSGVIDRFGQTNPKVLVCCDGYLFKGKTISLKEKIEEIVNSIPTIEMVLVTRYVGCELPVLNVAVEVIQELATGSDDIKFEELPFNHPLYIMYSSGTTGKPKCIVHGHGGTLLEHLKELVLHTDLKESDTIIYQTTCGWMMWNWVVSSLAIGSTLVMYDGNPMQRGGHIIFDILDDADVTIFGSNAKFISLIEKEGLKPKSSHKLRSLHTILSTGSPLLPESFEYVYRDIKEDICLSSISGGTDIIGCFALGSPTLPVYSGELQTRSLGLNVQVWDSQGKALVGERGELVCVGKFPSQPVCFWNDAEDKKYKEAYFTRFPGVWHHGDFVELTEHGGMIFYGRSDAVLNPGGIRIGTSEIYRQVEKFPEVEESIVIGQEWDNDVRVVLFLKMRKSSELTDELREKIKLLIRKEASPHHVPKKILSVIDIPRTRSGKITELAVRDVVHNREVKNTEALLNPESLEYFRNRIELNS